MRRYILLFIVMIMFLVSCSGEKTAEITVTPTLSPEEKLKQDYIKHKDLYVVFNRSTDSKYKYVSDLNILKYESKYADCMGTWFKEKLYGEDRIIYQSYLYAMENGYIGFSLYISDSEKDYSYIRQALSLDSPFLAQNYNHIGESTWVRPVDHIGTEMHFNVEQFTEDRLNLNIQALQKCRDIVAAIPASCETQEQKMEYLYRYVCDNVEYVAYEDMRDNDYLYDAVCEGKSICDGYSNMLNLLFNLIGVESYEVMGSNVDYSSELNDEELASTMGHTWVVAKINDSFYNFDPTFEDTLFDTPDNKLQFFGFSDELTPVKYIMFDTKRPKCTDNSRDFAFADLIVENLTDYEQTQKVISFTDDLAGKGQYESVIVVKDLIDNSDLDTFLNKYIYNVYNISYVTTSYYNAGNNTVIKFITEP